MDVNTIFEIFEVKETQYFAFSGKQLIALLNVLEYIDIEDKKRHLFLKRIWYLVYIVKNNFLMKNDIMI